VKTINFEEVAKLINRSRVTEIDLNPKSLDKGKWVIYSGENKVPHFKYNFYILALLSDATKDSIISASRALINPEVTQIVYAPSLEKKFKEVELKKLFPRNIAGIRNTNNYLLSFIQDQLTAYIRKLQSEPIKDYIEPRYKTPSGFSCRVPNPLSLFLSSPRREESDGELGIIIAEPGQGKTYTTRYLVNNLTQKKYLPIYISSPQWYTIQPESLASLWKTIAHSFKYYEAPIDWIEGCEEEFLQVTLKADLFKIIFDGFDEYVLWNKGEVDANDALRNLIKLAKVSGSSILVTSRTSFWESSIDKSLFEGGSIDLGVYQIEPFDRNHATNYFEKKFPNDKARISAAISIYDSLSSTGVQCDSNFVGRGFILSLIADLVERSEGAVTPIKKGVTIVQWVMEALCEREIKRQNLPIDKDQQILILREFAENISCGEKPTTELLREIIAATIDSLDESQINNLIGEGGSRRKRGKLQDHPLIRKNNIEGTWDIIHEQIRFNLLADQLLLYANASTLHLAKFINRLKVSGTLLNDLSASIVDNIFSVNDLGNINIKIKDIISKIMMCNNGETTTSEDRSIERYLAATIAMLAVNRLYPRSHGHKDRTVGLLGLLPNGEISRFHFSGTISSMDFSGIEFKDCKFNQVTWANCDFDEKTVFKKCYFIGGKAFNSKGFGKSIFEKTLYDSEAKSFINAELIQAKKKHYTNDDLKNDIVQIVKRFIPNEGVGFKAVHEENIDTGAIARSKYKNEIIEIFKIYILEEIHRASTIGTRYVVRDSAKESIMNYLRNGVFTGVLAETYEKLRSKLKI